MGRTLIDTCDPCEVALGIEGMPAERSIRITLDGGPPKRIEVCPQHLHMLKPLLDIYEQCGVDESLKPKRRTAQKQEELEPSPWFHEPRSEQPALPSAEPEKTVSKKEASDEPLEARIKVTCTLPHPSGKQVTMQYRSRANHAREAHGLRLWEIEWGDPDGVLTHPCNQHAECSKTGLAFPSVTSLARHLRMNRRDKVPEAS